MENTILDVMGHLIAFLGIISESIQRYKENSPNRNIGESTVCIVLDEFFFVLIRIRLVFKFGDQKCVYLMLQSMEALVLILAKSVVQLPADRQNSVNQKIADLRSMIGAMRMICIYAV